MTAEVTVVIPSHDTSGWARGAVQSVLDQGVRGVSVLLVDDGSTPDHAAALAALAGESPRTRLLRHDVNMGCRASRRHAWEIAGTELVAFLDDDDRHLPGYLEACLRVFTERPDVDAVHTRYWWVSMEGERTRLRPIRGNEGMIFRPEVERGTVKMSTLMVRTRALVGLEPIFEHYLSSGSYDLVLRLAYRHRFAFVDEPLVEVTDRTGSLSSNIRFHYRAEILEYLREALPDLDAGTRRRMVRKAAKYYRKAGRIALRTGNLEEARHFFGTGLRMHPSPPTLLGYLGSLLARPPSRVPAGLTSPRPSR